MSTLHTYSGYTQAQHSVGTVFTNYQLTSVDTAVRADGDITITLPALPSDNQTIVVYNIGTGTVTVDGNGNLVGTAATTTVPSGGFLVFYNGGYDASTYPLAVTPDWVVLAAGCDYTLPVLKDIGDALTGPFASEPATPADVSTTTTVAEFCAGTLQETVTVTYTLTHYLATDANAGYLGTDWFGTGEQLFASAALAWQRWYDSIPNDIAYSGWSTCPVPTGGSFKTYWYGEPTYAYDPITNNALVSDNKMVNAISGLGLTCEDIATRATVPFISTYTADASQVGFTAAEVWYLTATVTHSYSVI